jgi:hypothetical protein
MSIKTRFHPHGDGSFTIQRIEDVEPALENNKRLQNTPQHSESFHHVASIPPIFIEKMMNESGVPFYSLPSHELKKLIRRWRNNPDYRFLFTTDKRL